ncbi:MAG: hypothetical protein CMJ78_13975 [Planctomycetaceae bacterium]|nr:hypothetical protein [Planctomycetaceae bacterium]
MGDDQLTLKEESPSPRTILIQSILLAGGVFAFDALIPVEMVGAVAYVVVVLASLNLRTQTAPQVIAVLCGALVIGRIFLAPDLYRVDIYEIVTNRLLVIFGIWVTAALGIERIKSEVALRSMQDELEKRVQERTAELARSNDDLRKEIIDREHAEQASRDIEDRTGMIIDHALDAIISIDGGCAIMTWNQMAETTFGRSRIDALGELLPELLLPEASRGEFQQGIAAFLESGDDSFLNRRTSTTTTAQNGSEVAAEMTVVPIPWEGSFLFSVFIRAEGTTQTADAEANETNDTDESAEENAAEQNEENAEESATVD